MENILVNLLIVKIHHVRVKVLVVVVENVRELGVFDSVMTTKDVRDRTFDHSQRRKTEKVKLDETHGLKVTNILALRPRRLANILGRDQGHVIVKVFRDHNTTSMTGAGTHLTIESIDVRGHIRVLLKESLE